MHTIQETLHRYFGYHSFRHNQEEIIHNVLAKKTALF